MDNVELIIGNA